MVEAKNTLQGNLGGKNTLTGKISIPPGSGANYEGLSNLPKINDVKLMGNLSFEDLKLHKITNSELEDLLQ